MISTEAAAQTALNKCTAASTYANSTAHALSTTKDCVFTPKRTKIKLYKMAICSEAPQVGTTTGCSILFNDPAGRDVIINGTSASVSLANEITLTEGTYKYAVIQMSNKFGYDASFTFDSNRTDSSGGSGRYCYTNGTATTEFGVMDNTTCSASDASQFSVHSSVGFIPAGSPYNKIDGGTTIGTFSGYFMDANNQRATITLSPPSTNSDSIWVLQTFTNPPSITPNTSNIDFSILMTDSMRIKFRNNGSIDGMNLWQFGLKATVN